ncbi:MAG: zinc-finger domain-containing protein [Bacillus sp. (in: firmicutes)]
MNEQLVRKQLLKELDDTLKDCEGCFLYAVHKKDSGRAKAHKFCLLSCTVGAKLQELGKELNK